MIEIFSLTVSENDGNRLDDYESAGDTLKSLLCMVDGFASLTSSSGSLLTKSSYFLLSRCPSLNNLIIPTWGKRRGGDKKEKFNAYISLAAHRRLTSD